MLSRLDYESCRSVLSRADLRLLPAALLSSLFGQGIAAWRWSTMLKQFGASYSPTSAFRTYLAGNFYGLAMPGAVGGDVARVLLCRSESGTSLFLATCSVFAERALGIAALLLILAQGIACLPFVRLGLPGGLLQLFSVITLLSLFAALFLLKRARSGSALHFLQRGKSNLLERVNFLSSVSYQALCFMLLLSLLFQLTDIAATYLISQALHLHLSFTHLLVVLPVVYLATTIPISPAGLGVKEAVLAVMLTQFDLSQSEASLLALATFFNRFLLGMLGGVDHILRRLSPAEDIGEPQGIASSRIDTDDPGTFGETARGKKD